MCTGRGRDVTVAYAWNDYYADCCLEFVRRDCVTCCDGGLPL
ncbi:MAG: hypothetical protein SGJ19_16750 [Planctomycetia bacterium]|nr:hypothetical protein [Planctomycetia bacterium]